MKGRAARTGGFTLIEVLAALLLIGIVLPAVMQAISYAAGAGTAARMRSEAASLAEGKLNEIVATGQWQGGGNLSGDFGADWANYRWSAATQNWAQDTTSANLEEIDLTVRWTARNREDSLTLSTIAYDRTATTSSQ